ncbi:hypothetical protein [Butyrivibrio sp. FCS006]|uniref:hypothetical protein n=1 Tax=Butyrivibrio sp. FCS006 TaxID=1280684 RepID=UPI00041072BD|nr:hypothetical protein [Butyrivibrio sp. FCS006]
MVDAYYSSRIRWLVCNIALTIALLLIYYLSIPDTAVLWELPDETGYLWNAAWFIGIPWDLIAQTGMYYGYGYSVLLIPVVLISETGYLIVKLSYIVNMICIIATFWIYAAIIDYLDNKSNNPYWCLVAFASCLLPCLRVNAIKVNCETFLPMMLGAITLLLIHSLNKRYTFFWIFLGIVLSYMPFIHTRTLIIVFSFFLMLFIAFRSRIISLKEAIITLFAFSVSYVLLFFLKQQILSYQTYMYHLIRGETYSGGNLITNEFIIDRLQSLFSIVNLKKYLLALVSKTIYCIFATFGVCCFPYYSVIKRIKSKNRVQDKDMVVYFISISAALTVLAHTFGYLPENIPYLIYDRYYMYTIPLLICLGTYIYITEKIRPHNMLILSLFIILIGRLSLLWLDELMDLHMTMHIDTARISSFALFEPNSYSWATLLALELLFATIFMFILVLLKKKKAITIALLVVFLIAGQHGVSIINHSRTNFLIDSQIFNYINANNNDNSILFIDDQPEGHQDMTYTSLQVMINEGKIDLIDLNYNSLTDDIEKYKYVITYSGSTVLNVLKKQYGLNSNITGEHFTLLSYDQ